MANQVTVSTPSVPAPAPAAPAVPAATRADLRSDPKVLAFGNDVLAGTPQPQQQQLLMSFESLPPDIRLVIHDELAKSAPSPVEIDDDEIGRIVSLEHGRALAALWGRDTKANLGRCESRMRQLADSLDEVGAMILYDWYVSLPAGPKVALLTALARLG